jgi:iron complex transport system ATP-binding protein
VSCRYRLQAAGLRIETAQILSGITFSFDRPELVAVLGPNGAGKSTLLGILAGMRANYSGSCLFQDSELRQWNRREFARLVSFVPQTVRIEFPFTCEQVVLMGRTPHCAGLFESDQDWAAVERAMELTDSVEFRNRDFRTLSGGEKQRVLLASALAQSPRVLLLDEPTAFLDLKHQISVYELLRRLAREDLLVVTVTHDLNLAASYCDRAIVLSHGRLAADAPPRDALRAETIAAVYGVQAQVRQTETGRSWITYGG